MKNKFVYLGSVGDIYMFEETPEGPIKNSKDFSKYFDFFSKKSFKDELMSRSDFVVDWRKRKKLVCKEQK